MLKSKKIVDWLYDYSLYFIIGALLLVIIAIEPSFVRVSNFTTILTQSATKIIYACGIAGIIVLGGTDLALGREVGLAAVVAASLLQAVDYSQRVFSADQVPALPLIVPLLLVMVLLGIICAAHGFIVAHWGVAPFVASLGVQLISYGLCLQYFNTVCNSNPLSGFTKTYSKFCQGTIRIGNISLSYLMFYAIAVVAVMWVIWNRTTLGKNMFAIGGNREAAKVCGVNVKRTIIIVYIIAGLLYAFGGVLEAGRTGSAINEGVYMVRPGGKVLVCGYISEDFKVNYQEVMKFEKEILGMRGMTRQDMAEVVELVNQRKIVPYVYKTVPFEQINEALGLLRDGKTKGRVVLLFPED